MKKIVAHSEVKPQKKSPKFSQIPTGKISLLTPWKEVLNLLLPEGAGVELRPIQTIALGRHKILENRKNLIIAAPTNSGKSLIGYLILIEALIAGKRAIWLSPLKALAREKTEELKLILPKLEKILNKKLSIHLTTGDYRIEHELFTAPPPSPKESSIIIATPERMEAILRNPKYQDWFRSVGTVCVDEAHLLRDRNRGPILEYLLTSLLNFSHIPPRILLLSASFGDTERAEKWLAPCETIRFMERIPPLAKEVWDLSAEEEKDEVILQWLREEVLVNSENQALIFVYQKSAAEKLARLIKEKLSVEAAAFHARLGENVREKTREKFTAGKTKVLVATTALALGINLPATHVLVRDTVFPGAKNLSPAELLQMMGRAGRNERQGKSVVLIKENDVINQNNAAAASKLAEDLFEENLPELTSAFSVYSKSFHKSKDDSKILENTIRIAKIIGGLLIRKAEYGLSLSEIQMFFARSLGGSEFAETVPKALAWLQSPERVLAFENKDNKKIKLTTLGKTAALAVLPFQIAAGYGQLIRDIMSIDSKDEFLSGWRVLDHVLLLQLFSSRNLGRRFSNKLVTQVDAWMEQHPSEVPLLYREWIRGDEKTSRAQEVFGSLGLSNSLAQTLDKQKNDENTPYRRSYLALLRTILLWERSRGTAAEELERIWGIENLSGMEESLRDEMLWLLAASKDIWQVKPFYFHLKEECKANEKRLKRLKQIFRDRQQQIYTLLDQIKYCSPLGATFRRLKNKESALKIKGIGITSIRRLEKYGYKSLSELVTLSEKDLVGLGLRSVAAKELKRYFRLRAL